MTPFNLTNTERLRSDQYKDSSNLNARAYLHDRFSTNKTGLQGWIFDQFVELEIHSILDIGCGPGYLWVQNIGRIPEHWELSFADISWGMLNEARDQIAQKGTPLRYAVSDAQALPYPDDSFDLVIANHMLYHVPDLEMAFAQIRRVLRSGGRLYCTTNSENHMHELFEMLGSVGVDRIRWKETAEAKLPFSLENGSQLLRKWFSEVEIRIFEDSLKVTEVDPLLNYVLSMSGMREALARDSERMRHLRSVAQEALDTKGFIHISKDPGLFIAR